jgi:hypothetical protein
MEIWNGTHGNRKTLTQATAPRHDDYVAIVGQIANIQKFMNSMSGNAEVMPDIKGQVLAAQAKLEEVKALISDITPPADLVIKVDAISQRLDEIDVRQRLDGVDKIIEANTKSVGSVESAMDSLEELLTRKMAALENKTRNDLAAYKTEVTDKMAALEKENARLNRLFKE